MQFESNKLTMRQKIQLLNQATVCYDAGAPIMEDKEWDDIYFALKAEEENTGIVYPDSPTQSIPFEIVSALNKITHSHAMLSLDKTKDVSVIKNFIGESPFIAMAKLDGLTCSLTYKDGELISAETRGNGYVGEDILHNAEHMSSIPKKINFMGTVVIDGEVITPIPVLDEWNKEHPQQTYKNCRNYAAGSIRLLSAEESKNRGLYFMVWDVIEGVPAETLEEKLIWAKTHGFSIVPFAIKELSPTIETSIEEIKNICKDVFPIDGVVFKFNNCKEYESKGKTDHHFKGGMAYKFYDDEYETSLRFIEWTMGRKGALTPVAVFEPVDTDDSIIERASLHNISVMKDILGKPYIGQKIKVAKMNMIIPQVTWGDGLLEGEFCFCPKIPDKCPICGSPAIIETSETGVDNLVCTNPNCSGMLINVLDHFCGKTGLDIKGLSKKTLEKLIDFNWINSINDIFTLREHRQEWIGKYGFGQTSVDKILDEIDAKSKEVDLANFLCAIGIPLIGKVAAKDIADYCGSYEVFKQKRKDGFRNCVKDIGEITDEAIAGFDYTYADIVAEIITFNERTKESAVIEGIDLQGKIFVITGKVSHFKNRNELSSYITAHNGKVTGSVSKNTNYLIANAPEDTSKYKKAVELGIPIITEKEFINLTD